MIVYNVARFARNMEDDVVIAAELERLGVRLVSATEQFDGTPFGKFMRRLLGAQAELYSENLSLEAKRGLHQKAKLGGTPGPAPLGYLNVHKQIDGCWIATVEVDPERGDHIRWAFVAYATGGYTLDTLHAALGRRGLVTRKTRKYAATRSAGLTSRAPRQPVLRRHRPLRRDRIRRATHAADRQGHLLARPGRARRPQQLEGKGPQAPPLPQGQPRLRALRSRLTFVKARGKAAATPTSPASDASRAPAAGCPTSQPKKSRTRWRPSTPT